eukprot:9037112-Ditylum_brightwellii.AAC.1
MEKRHHSPCTELKVLMIDYIQKLLDDMPDKYDGEAVTPAAKHLFEVNEEVEKLGKEDADLFHHI